MISLLDNYITEFKNFTNHQDALKHFQVRFSSFNQNYPKDCTLPTCTLAQYGFYFDEKNKTIKCYECDFKYDELNQDSIFSILNKHYKHRPNCSQVTQALDSIIYEDTKKNETETMDIDDDFSNRSGEHSAKKAKNVYTNEETRFQTFENVKMILNAKNLSENGFYMVSKDTQANAGLSMSKSKSSSNFSSVKEELNQIERIATLVPALIYIKCAYCPYECLIFKNSLLNTMFKSPMEEHWEKSNKTCTIFTDSKTNKFSPVKVLDIGIESQHDLYWLQCLLDFDTVSNEAGSKKVVDILVNQNDINKKTEDFLVKQIPKVIDQLIINEKNKLYNSSNNSSLKDQKGDNVLYVPKSGAIGSGPTTSDFSKLQNVLNLSDNVISEKAIHPAYTLYQTRVESFKEWPATLSQQPADLAKAGFYYFGIKDMVKCFFCNGGLKNWDHNDDPYEDHVRWFPKCQFVRQLMGADYVEHIKEKYKNQDSGFTTEGSTSNDNLNSGINRSQNSSSNNRNQTKPKRSVSPRTLNSRLDTNIIRRMLDSIQVITKDSIKQSIETQLSSNNIIKVNSTLDKKNTVNTANIYGDDFKSPIEMAKLAIELEKNKTEKIEAYKTISDFIICHIDQKINIENIQNFILFKHGIYPNHVRILREKGSLDRCFAFVSLCKKDEQLCDEIVRDLNHNHKLLNKNERILAFKTVWNEFEEKIKPLLTKPTAVSTSMDQITDIENTTTVNPEIKTNEIKPSEASTIEKEFVKTEPKSTIADDGVNDDKSILMEENERLKSERLCVICLNKDKNVLFLPCAHLAACLDCSFNLQNCPICRSKIQATVRTYS